jgi:hypothetical protein
MNLKSRLKKLERVNGAGKSPLIVILRSFGGQPLTPEETAALDNYLKKVEAESLAEGEAVKVILWTRERAQELLAAMPKT